MTATARPKTGWRAILVQSNGEIGRSWPSDIQTARRAAAVYMEYSKFDGPIASCVDNDDGIHNDNSYGDIEVLRWAGLR